MTGSRMTGLVALIGAFVWMSRVFAQEPEPSSQARVLFYDARRLMAEQRWAEACPKLEASEREDPGKGTEFNLADCYEHVGRLASALALFERVAAESHADKMPAHEALARQRVQALSSRVPVLTVDVGPEARVDDLELYRDGKTLPTLEWSTPIHVDPGRHTIAARAPNRTPWENAVELAEGAAVTVHVPPLATLVQATPVPSTSSAPASMPGDQAQRAAGHATGDPGGVQKTIGLALGGAGLATVAVGAVFGALSLAARNQANAVCRGSACTSTEGVDDRTAAMDRGNVATLLVITGACVTSAAVVVWLTAPSSRSALRLRAMVGAGKWFGIGIHSDF
jgi:hypothetical protein